MSEWDAGNGLTLRFCNLLLQAKNVNMFAAGEIFLRVVSFFLTVMWDDYPGPVFSSWLDVKSFLHDVSTGRIR